MTNTIWITKLPTKNLDFDGLGYYSGFFAKQMQNIKLFVLCQKNGDENTEFDKLEYPNAEVSRCFKPNNIFSWFGLLSQIFKTAKKNQIKNIHIQYEFFSYASPSKGVLLLTLIGFFSRAIGLKVSVTLHQIPAKSDVIERIEGGNFKANFLFLGIKNVFKLIATFSNHLVVHETLFVDRLIKVYGIKAKKISCIPHVSYNDLPSLADERTLSKLSHLENKPIRLLFFGYLSWYKGLDNLIKDYLDLKPEMKKLTSLTIVGGEHPFQKYDKSYQNWLSKQREITSQENGVIWYGFANDEDLPDIFKAHNALVLPYKNVFSSSGPFAWATSFGIPVIVSGAMEYLTELGFLGYENPEEFESVLEELKNNLDKYVKLAKQINVERGINNIEKMLLALYNS